MGVWIDRQRARRRERALRRQQDRTETGTIVWYEPDPEEARRRERAIRRGRRRTVAYSIAWAMIGLAAVSMDETYMFWVGLALIAWGVTNTVVTLRKIGREPLDESNLDRDSGGS